MKQRVIDTIACTSIKRKKIHFFIYPCLIQAEKEKGGKSFIKYTVGQLLLLEIRNVLSPLDFKMYMKKSIVVQRCLCFDHQIGEACEPSDYRISASV